MSKGGRDDKNGEGERRRGGEGKRMSNEGGRVFKLVDGAQDERKERKKNSWTI